MGFVFPAVLRGMVAAIIDDAVIKL